MRITSPTLLVDKDKVVRNVVRMRDKATRANVIFRPHFKTHQSAVIGEWIRDLGVEKITVSSTEMAAYFAAHGWSDITVAFPLNPHELDAVSTLAWRITLNVTVSGEQTARVLAASRTTPLGVFVEIDTGYRRTGIDAGDISRIRAVLDILSVSRHDFRGFLVHAGNTYRAATIDEICEIYKHNMALLGELCRNVSDRSDSIIISYGDTPSCSIVEHFDVVTELRPGNFVFYDIVQHRLGACELDDIAVALACPIIAVSRDRREVAVHGGAVHLSKDHVNNDDGTPNYGEVVAFDGRRWLPNQTLGYVHTISQEHGLIAASEDFLKSASVGDIVAVLPIHSCLTADCMNVYVDLDGNTIFQRPKNIFSACGAQIGEYERRLKNYC